MEKNFNRYIKLKIREMGLDLKDQKILDLLRANCRFNNSEIGKMSGLSKESVLFRLKKLEERGVIGGYITLIDPVLAGLQKYFLLMKFNDIKSIKKFFKRVESLKYITFCNLFQGEYDLAIEVVVDENKKLDYIMDKIKELGGEGLTKLDLLIEINSEKPLSIFNVIKPNLRNFSKSSFQKYFLERKEKKPMRLDEKDKKIIKILQEKANTPLVKIQQQTKLSINTIYERIKKMILSGVIQRFMITASADKMGLEYYKIFISFKKTNKKIEKEFKDYLRNFNLTSIVKNFGKWDYSVGARFLDNKQVIDFVENLEEKFSKHIKKISVLSFAGGSKTISNFFAS